MNQDFTVQKKQYFVWNKNSCRGVHLKKKILHKQWAKKKKFVQAENPPPPPHHFSNGPSLMMLCLACQILFLTGYFSQFMRNRIFCLRVAGTRLATALRRRPFSACNKGNRRRLHAGNFSAAKKNVSASWMWMTKSDFLLSVNVDVSCAVLSRWTQLSSSFCRMFISP